MHGKAFFVLVLLVLSGARAATGQTAVAIDPKAADAGMALFTVKGCTGCHTIGGGRLGGPDLAGVTARRDTSWINRLLEDPPAMAEKDTIVQRLVEESNGIIMPNLGLTPAERRALIHYLARESERLRSSK